MFRRSSKRSSSRSGDDDVSVLSTTSSVKSSNSFLSIRSLPVTSRDESAVFNPLRLGRRNKGQSRPRNKNRLLAGRKDLPHAEIVVTTTTTKQKSAKDARADDLARMFEKYEEIAGQEEEDDYDVCSTVSGASRGAYSVMSNGGDYSSASAMSARERMIANSLKAQQQRFASVSSQSEAGGVARDRMRVRKAQQQQQQLAQPPSKPGNASALQVFLAREEEKAKQSQRNLRYQQDYGDVDIRSTSSYGGKSSHVDRSSAMRRGSSNGKSKNAVEKFGKRRSLDLVTGQLQPQRQTKLYSASGLPEERGVNMNGPKDGNRTPHLLRLLREREDEASVTSMEVTSTRLTAEERSSQLVVQEENKEEEEEESCVESKVERDAKYTLRYQPQFTQKEKEAAIQKRMCSPSGEEVAARREHHTGSHMALIMCRASFSEAGYRRYRDKTKKGSKRPCTQRVSVSAQKLVEILRRQRKCDESNFSSTEEEAGTSLSKAMNADSTASACTAITAETGDLFSLFSWSSNEEEGDKSRESIPQSFHAGLQPSPILSVLALNGS